MHPGITEEINSVQELHLEKYSQEHFPNQITFGLDKLFVRDHLKNIIIAGKKLTHKSSVVSVKLDPLSSRVCASASTDGTCLITSCYIKEVDTDSNGPFGNVTSFGETLISINSIGWMNTVSFSLDAKTLCYSSNIFQCLNIYSS